MENNLFRKSSLERIQSPEQLNEYVKITNPGVWLVLIGLFALLVSAGIWAFTGTIPETVQMTGVAYSTDGSVIQVYCYGTMSLSKRLREGMEVQISPDYAPREEYGYIYGKIERIGEQPVTEAEILRTFGSMQYVYGILPPGNAVEVVIELAGTDGVLHWSNKKGNSVSVSSGSYCELLIVTKERRPYELVLK